MTRKTDRWTLKSKLHTGVVTIFTIHTEFSKGCPSGKKKEILDELKQIFFLQSEWDDSFGFGFALYGGVFCKDFYASIREELREYIKEEALGGNIEKFRIALNNVFSPYIHSSPKGLGRFIGWGTYGEELHTRIEDYKEFKWAEGHNFVLGTTSKALLKEELG